jgi:hypothetical protein
MALTDPGERLARTAAARDRLKREFGLAPWIEKYKTIYRAIMRSSV